MLQPSAHFDTRPYANAHTPILPRRSLSAYVHVHGNFDHTRLRSIPTTNINGSTSGLTWATDIMTLVMPQLNPNNIASC